jgi:hypothetical protein
LALALLLAATMAPLLVGGCTASPASTPSATRSAKGAAGPAAASSPAGAATPAPHATITAGPVPPAAAQAAVRYWRLVGAHRYRALLGVVTLDSQDATAVKAGHGAQF